jgi:hypothetical protein
MEKKISLTVSTEPPGRAARRVTYRREDGRRRALSTIIYQEIDGPRTQSAAGRAPDARLRLLLRSHGLAVKLASRSLSNSAVVFFRNAVGLVTLLPWLGRLGMRGLATRDVRGHLIRSLAGSLPCTASSMRSRILRLADAVLLNYSLPLFMPFIARLWLREPIPSRLWRSLGLGFAGIALILKPGMELFNPIALVALAAALLAALAQVGVRSLTVTEPATRIVFYFSVISTAVSTLPLLGSWRPPSPRCGRSSWRWERRRRSASSFSLGPTRAPPRRRSDRSSTPSCRSRRSSKASF